MAILAILLEDYGVRPHPVAGYVGRLVDLSEHATDRERWVLIGPAEIETARSWIREGIAILAAMPRDEEGFVVLRDVPRTVGAHCPNCPMRRACAVVEADAHVEQAA